MSSFPLARISLILFGLALLGSLFSAPAAADEPAAKAQENRYVLLNAAQLFPGITDPGTRLDGTDSQPYPFASRLRISEGEAYFLPTLPTNQWMPVGFDSTRIAASFPQGTTPTLAALVRSGGELLWQEKQLTDDALVTTGDARQAFWNARTVYYHTLWSAELPGGAWFRHQFRESVQRADDATSGALAQSQFNRWNRWTGNWGTGTDIERTFGMFSGGRALEENLQLDFLLRIDDATGTVSDPLAAFVHHLSHANVSIGEITPLTVEEIDWEPLLKDRAEPAKDHLASHLPHDNLSILLPSFGDMVRLVDRAEELGNPLADLYARRAENQETRARVERQLALPLDQFARLIGPALISEVAVTLDDPYLRDGTGIAILFRTSRPDALVTLINERREFAVQEMTAANAPSDPEIESIAETVAGRTIAGAASKDRQLSSYVAQLADDVVAVGNSLPLMKRLAEGAQPSLDSLDEYAYFRSVYPAGDGSTAFFLLTDAAIRKWSSPQWRIGQSRRIRARAAMAEQVAGHVDRRLAEAEPDGPMQPYHPNFGTMDFATPIAEMTIDKVTGSEHTQYNFFRDQYQDRWRRFFDPIAARVDLRDGLDIDVTIMPLIAGSDYRDLIELTANGSLGPNDGDRHPDSLVHFIWHLNPESRVVRSVESMMTPALGGVEAPLRWIGSTIEVYADTDEFWQKMADAEDSDDWMEENWAGLPVAVRIGVRNPLMLASFLTGLRGMVESSAPGLTTWVTSNYLETPYVHVRASEDALDQEVNIYYLTQPRALTISLNEAVIQRAIERTKNPAAETEPWLGGNAAVQADEKAMGMLMRISRDALARSAREQAFKNLPILNEWKRLFPERDPVEVHREFFRATLESPMGAGYRWNESARTMESITYGHANAVVADPPVPMLLKDFGAGSAGLTFEHDGARARVVLRPKASE